jgi:hypothetical protein
LYGPDGTKRALVVTVPAGTATAPGTTETPTGIAANTTHSAFSVGGKPSFFIFDSEDRTISAWGGGPQAVIAVDKSTRHAVYKGLALLHNKVGDFLLAANFRSAEVEVYNQNYQPV